MAIRNVGLGGATDWSNGEILEAPDLNDTFDAGTSKIQTLTTFWLNSDLYDVYDDFESYSVGAFTTNDDWTISTSGGGSPGASIVEGDLFETGSEKYLRFGANSFSSSHVGTTTASAITKNLSQNKHKHIKLSYELHGYIGAVTTSTQVRLGSSSTITLVSNAGQTTVTGFVDLLVIAKGNNLYDVYNGPKKILSNTEQVDPQIAITTRIVDTISNSGWNGWGFTRIDDVVESKSAVE